jgi:uncharacterized membrane protein
MSNSKEGFNMSAIKLTQHLPENMGQMDRIIRSAIGGALLVNGLKNPSSFLCRLGSFIGGAFIFYGITGYDPLLQVTNSTTLPGDKQNLIKKIQKQVKQDEPEKSEKDLVIASGV